MAQADPLFASPFLLAIVVLSLWLSPWAEARRLEYERQLESREELSLLTPGLFKEFRQAKLVVFIESINTLDGTIRNVFLHSIDSDKDVTTVARSGHLEEAPNGDRFIVLQDGRRYEGTAGSADFRTAEFERLGRRIEPAEVRTLPASLKAMPTDVLALADGAPERAEMFWRISVPISALLLVLLAVPLSYVNPRMGRSFNLFARCSRTCSTSTASTSCRACRAGPILVPVGLCSSYHRRRRGRRRCFKRHVGFRLVSRRRPA
jgi:lipopolysaccharide export system permease protein